MKKRPSFLSVVVYVLVVGIAVFLAAQDAIQTWPNNAIDYAVGASNPIPTIQARLVPNTKPNPTSVLGRPTLAPDFLNRVLSAAHSPAQGTGQALYDLGVKYGIDDAYALAFFHHELSYGTTGEATVTYSLGNERCIPDRPCIDQQRGGYALMHNWIDGYDHWYSLILNLYIKQWGRTTVETIVPKYAPNSDGNNEAEYIASIEQDVVQLRAGQVSL